MRIKITLMYDGSDFCGWQSQKNLDSVQTVLETALKKLTGEEVKVVGSGRTDAGVHAVGQTAHFDLTKQFPVRKIVTGMNFYLPPSIRVSSAEEVGESFHARKSVVRKTYMYRMYLADVDNPLKNLRALRVENADMRIFRENAAKFIGEKDFSAFMSSGSSAKTTVRTVYEATLREEDGEWRFYISANGFLYNMVRKIVGVLLAVAQGKRDASYIDELFSGGKAKEIAPPYALYLHHVEY